jgi:hypothetical protein
LIVDLSCVDLQYDSDSEVPQLMLAQDSDDDDEDDSDWDPMSVGTLLI